MRILKLIFPVNDNDGKTLDHAHEHIHHTLLNEFGGYTVQATRGYWKDDNGVVYDDVGKQYEIAVDQEENLDSMFGFVGLIKWLLTNTDQKAIFTEYDGFAAIQTPKSMGLVK